jgi:hypothetical protein
MGAGWNVFGSRIRRIYVVPLPSQARKAVRVRAADTTEEAQVDIEKYVDDLKEKVRLVCLHDCPPLPVGNSPACLCR